MTDAVNIFVIDDSEDDRLLYRRALQKSSELKYHISEANDGEEGLNRLQESPPSCILLDYSMPGQSGVEVLKRIREKYPFIAVVMLTGHGDTMVAVNAMKEGAQDYLSKDSITSEGLQKSVQNAIEKIELLKQLHTQNEELKETNTGIGIAKDKQEYIFEKFTQVDSSSTRQFGGVGLGLSICKTLVTMMDGKIGVISDSGKGATFWIELKLPIHYENIKNAESHTQEKVVPQYKANLLIAEDIPDNSYVLQEMLEQMGCTVAVANDGAEALRKIEEKQGQFDIILMDCQMPNMDGYESTRIIRTKPWGADIPIIAVTANALNDDRNKCINSGMTDYITKPVKFGDIEKILQKYVS